MAASMKSGDKWSELFGDGESPIDMKRLRALCFAGGCPEHIRPLSWRYLLQLIEPAVDFTTRNARLAEKRNSYISLLNHSLRLNSDSEASDAQQDNPLNLSSKKYNKFHENIKYLDQIDKDCTRLLPDYALFQRPTDFPLSRICAAASADSGDERFEVDPLRSLLIKHNLNCENIQRDRMGNQRVAERRLAQLSSADDLSDAEMQNGDGSGEAHWEVCRRILYVYYVFNGKYVQGMNEILGPIYYTFASDAEIERKSYAEHDSYMTFQFLMSLLNDIFDSELDNSDLGVLKRLDNLYSRLLKIEPAIHEKLLEVRIDPSYFAFKWLTCLFSQDFPIPDVQRLWDMILAYPDRNSEIYPIVINVMIAMLRLQRREILAANGMNEVFALLQTAPSSSPLDSIIGEALKLSDPI